MTAPTSTLFIVEDDPVMRSLLVELFVEGGYGVTSAGSDEHVTGLVRESRPDVILMDFRDSIDDRCAAVEELKQDPTTGHIPIVALSDWHALESDPAHCHLDRVVEKPYHPMVLLNQVKRTCESLPRDRAEDIDDVMPSIVAPEAPLPAVD